MTPPRTAWPGLALRVFLSLAVPTLAGCGVPQGKLSGRVLYQGKPLPGGRLTFRPADPSRNSVSVPISADGSYEAVLPAGEVAICVDNRELQPVTREAAPPVPPGAKLPAPQKQPERPPREAGAAGRGAGNYVPIPEKYYEVERSGLTYTVKSGDNTHDIELQ
jgi:hypothetical protein